MCTTPSLTAQDPQPAPADHSQRESNPHEQMPRDAALRGPDVPHARGASGTAWQPDGSLMSGIHRSVASWDLMADGTLFAQYLKEGGYFGGSQLGSINWLMGMGSRPFAGGSLTLRGMVSLEPWTIRGCGYPDMLATGEVCRGEPIHDKQHPHDLLMEAAVEYTHPLGESLAVQVYGGPAGEPALGPVPFPHRRSAFSNPIAPIAHHWLDASHITFGVVTGGIYGPRWKLEASAFNGREPDEHRRNVDLGAFDSVSGRIWFLPGLRWALQASAGHLREAETAHEGRGRADADLLTASATYHRALPGDGRFWASTVAWGRRKESTDATSFLLAESSVTLDTRDTWFSRAEIGAKAPHEVSIHGLTEAFPMGKLQMGYVRSFKSWHAWQLGFGASVSASVVADPLAARYGGRVTWGSGVFLTLRPAAMSSTDPHAGHLMN